jgi:hypothetical protein
VAETQDDHVVHAVPFAGLDSLKEARPDLLAPDLDDHGAPAHLG